MLRIVQLGTPRVRGEGTRIGTVRRPPRGVPKERYAEDDWFDVWLPNLSPSKKLIDSFRAKGDDEAAWDVFARKFDAEMHKPDALRVIDVLATLSHTANFSIGCYCADPDRCHRSILEDIFFERLATMKG